jgi:hypothetical protein
MVHYPQKRFRRQFAKERRREQEKFVHCENLFLGAFQENIYKVNI